MLNVSYDAAVGQRRVLVVEDDADIAFLLRFWLEGDERCSGVAHASSPAEAVQAALEERPDTVLLDFMLTGGTAADCLPDLRRALPDARIIVYTAFVAGARDAGVLELGADHLVEKVRVVVEDVANLALDA